MKRKRGGRNDGKEAEEGEGGRGKVGSREVMSFKEGWDCVMQIV